MSHEPSSPTNRWRLAVGETGAALPGPPPRRQRPRRPTVVVIQGAGKPKRPKVRVEGARPADPRVPVVTKWAATTERLTSEERQVLSGFRLSLGGPTAAAEKRRIQADLRSELRKKYGQ